MAVEFYEVLINYSFNWNGSNVSRKLDKIFSEVFLMIGMIPIV